MKVTSTDSGMEIAVMIVERMDRRKMRMTMTAKMATVVRRIPVIVITFNLRTTRPHDQAGFGEFWPHGRRRGDARAESVVSPISRSQGRPAGCRNLRIPHGLRID